MSRCSLGDEENRFDTAIGWDPGTESFFAIVYDFDEERRKTYPMLDWRNGWTSPAIDPNGDDVIIMWFTPYKHVNYDEPDELIEAIKPYSISFDKEILRRELMIDKENNEGARNYHYEDIGSEEEF